VKQRDWLFRFLLVMGAATLATGLVQLTAPTFVLGLLRADVSGIGPYLFRIVGMFMALFGGLIVQSLLDPRHHPVAIQWSGIQKVGAGIAVAIGVMTGAFRTLAWSVSLFDLASGILLFVYLKRINGAHETV
jgi:hypothetical protein